MMSYGSEKVVLMVVNYKWKPDPLSYISYYFVERKNFIIKSILIIN